MLNSKSVKARFFVSFASNALRALLSFATGLILARGLAPAGYGDLAFLLGSFVAIRSLLDLGTSNAFYTFISQERRPLKYYTYYFSWLCAQFLLTAAVIFAVFPDELISRVWLGHARGVILLAFSASFLQQQVWQTVNQVGEAARDTLKVQLLNVSLTLVYLLGAGALAWSGSISVPAVLGFMIALYLVFSALAVLILLGGAKKIEAPGPRVTLAEMFGQYRKYCSPLILLSVIGFAHDFADKWLLQFFGGSGQQGFYQVAFQFSTVSILATASMLNIFWKEISEASKLGDTKRIAALFGKVSRGLYMVGAVISGFLIPWSAEILGALLGKAYAPAGLVFSLMLFYPVHGSLGQIAGTMMFAGERTKQYLAVSAFFMLLSLPVSYLLQAPVGAVFLPGLGLGALGLALKMVLLNIACVNVMLWVVARNNGWKFEWAYQAGGLALALAGGYLARGAAAAVFPGHATEAWTGLLPALAVSGTLYAAFVGWAFWLRPGLIGRTRSELRDDLGKLGTYLRGRI